VKRDCQCPRAKHRHGTVAAYLRDKCRCFRCRYARHLANQAYKAGETWREFDTMPRIGVQRRLQALAAIGVNAREIAERTGLSVSHVENLRNSVGRHTAVTRHIWELVAGVYDALWDKPNTTANGKRCVTMARRYGYAPPMAWDDDDLDDPTATPHLPTDKGWALKPCGTPAAYRRHLRNGEKPCRACEIAEADRPRSHGRKAA
jgi:hypothetical protein